MDKQTATIEYSGYCGLKISSISILVVSCGFEKWKLSVTEPTEEQLDTPIYVNSLGDKFVGQLVLP